MEQPFAKLSENKKYQVTIIVYCEDQMGHMVLNKTELSTAKKISPQNLLILTPTELNILSLSQKQNIYIYRFISHFFSIRHHYPFHGHLLCFFYELSNSCS